MPEDITIPLMDLLVDTRNARLAKEQGNQQEAILAIATQQGTKLLKLAADIVTNGLDPLNPPAIVPTDDRHKRYVVIEGNRRITALKILETPNLVASAYGSADQKKLTRLSEQFAADPISSVRCVKFATEKEMEHWVDLRHTGQNEGIGVVEWGSAEKDRYATRHGLRSPEGQILDFVEKAGILSDAAKASETKIISNIKRLISSPAVKEKVGIEIVGGQVMMRYPADQVLKSLTYVVEVLKTGQVNVKDIYNKEDRIKFADSLPSSFLPDPSGILGTSLPLGEPPSPQPTPNPPKPKPPKPPTMRTELIPKSCRLTISQGRISIIYNELQTMSVNQFANACSVLLRVFVELSVDHYVSSKGLTFAAGVKPNLALKMKAGAADMLAKGLIDAALEMAVKKVADSNFVLAAATVTFNQYVHNKYVYPKAGELILGWDEMQPFMEKLWP